MTHLLDETLPNVPSRRFKNPLSDSQGSVLFMAVILLCLLSVLVLLATDTILLGKKALEALQFSLELFYIAEAGLAHGHAFCQAHGEASFLLADEAEEAGELHEPAIGVPFNVWLPYGRGRYQIKAYVLGQDDQPFIDRYSGILLVATARLQGDGQKRLCCLLEDPPSWRSLAWWEPE